MKLLKWTVLVIIISAGIVTASTYTVTTGSGIGSGSLHQAILSANQHPGPDTIVFERSGGNPPYYFVISFNPPPITDNGTFINGYSQSGSVPNTGGPSEPDNAVINLVFDGQLIDSSFIMFTVQSDSNEICGFKFANLKTDSAWGTGGPILIDGGSYNHVWGCWFGLDTSGTQDAGNRHMGVMLEGGAHHNVIGGNTPAERNVFAGNDLCHILITDKGSDANVIAGNFIGTTKSGSAKPQFVGTTGYGIMLEGTRYIGGPSGNIIGGEDSTYANIIAGNPQAGIYFANWGTGGNKIIGNKIGVSVLGQSLGNTGAGIMLDKGSLGDTIVDNWISYNKSHGVFANDSNTNNHVIMNNVITDNEGDGVRLYGLVQKCLVKECEIARNEESGIYVAGPASDYNTFSMNSIYENGAIGIDLAPIGITDNDGNDNDAEANDNMNFPVIDSASTSHVYGKILGNSKANAAIEVFLAYSDSQDPASYGEGKTYLGSGTTDASGNFVAYIDPSLVTIGNYITATATDTKGSTSEFMKKRSSISKAAVVETPVTQPLALDVKTETDRVLLSYSLTGTSNVRLAVYDASGSLVAELASGMERAGNHTVSLNTSKLSSGVYFATLSSGAQTMTAKFTVLRVLRVLR